jgi:hypothetical protein
MRYAICSASGRQTRLVPPIEGGWFACCRGKVVKRKGPPYLYILLRAWFLLLYCYPPTKG